MVEIEHTFQLHSSDVTAILDIIQKDINMKIDGVTLKHITDNLLAIEFSCFCEVEPEDTDWRD